VQVIEKNAFQVAASAKMVDVYVGRSLMMICNSNDPPSQSTNIGSPEYQGKGNESKMPAPEQFISYFSPSFLDLSG